VAVLPDSLADLISTTQHRWAPAGRRRGVVQTDATRHMLLRLCAFPVAAFGALTLASFPSPPIFRGRQSRFLVNRTPRYYPGEGRANTIAVSSTRICQDCALMKSKLRRWLPASAATIRHSRESGNPVSCKQRRWVPASAAKIRHSRESGNPVSYKQRRWVPASVGTTLSYFSPS
jgi:hypothetical protein